MTKKIKQILGVVMAAMLCFALTPTAAFAAGEAQPMSSGSNDDTGTITIDNAIDGYEYNAYQVLVLEKYNTEYEAYLYKAADGWGDWLAGQAAYVSIDEDGYVSWVGEGEQAVAQFAKDAVAFAKESGIAAAATGTAENSKVEFTGLNLGYYAVDSSLGALCSLNTTAPDATIQEKNDEPSIDKQVEEGEDNWGSTNDASIGDTVNFKVIVTGQAGAQNYVLHDQMDDGLTYLADSLKVKDADGVEITIGEGWDLLTQTDGCVFEIQFADALFADLVRGQSRQYIVEYSAILNENAAIQVAERNKAQLTYGDNGHTEWDITDTYTWGMQVVKVNGDDTTQKLAGAKFTLKKQGSEDSIAFNLVAVENATDETAETYKVAANGTVTEITTNKSGEFYIHGLDAGVYELIETAAPEGFNMKTDPTIVTISRGDNGIANVQVVTVENKTGSFLPSTGGMGTTILYVVGGVLVIGAIIFLVRRRSSATK